MAEKKLQLFARPYGALRFFWGPFFVEGVGNIPQHSLYSAIPQMIPLFEGLVWEAYCGLRAMTWLWSSMARCHLMRNTKNDAPHICFKYIPTKKNWIYLKLFIFIWLKPLKLFIDFCLPQQWLFFFVRSVIDSIAIPNLECHTKQNDWLICASMGIINSNQCNRTAYPDPDMLIVRSKQNMVSLELKCEYNAKVNKKLNWETI